MAPTDKCGNVTNEEGPTATAQKMMDVVDWCFQQTKRTRRRKRSRPADKLPERLVHRDDLVKTVLEGRSRTVRGVAGLINSRGVLNFRGLRRRAAARRIQGSDGLANLLVHLLP